MTELKNSLFLNVLFKVWIIYRSNNVLLMTEGYTPDFQIFLSFSIQTNNVGVFYNEL